MLLLYASAVLHGVALAAVDQCVVQRVLLICSP
jgi:hypothetical protein